MKKKLFTVISAALGSLLLLSVIAFALVQTEWVQRILVRHVVQKASEEGLYIEVEELESLEPFRWQVEKLTFTLDDKTRVDTGQLEIRISPLSLLRKKLTLRTLIAGKVEVTFDPTSTGSEAQNASVETLKNIQNASFTLPFDLDIRHLSCPKVTLENLATQKTLRVSCIGSVHIQQKGKEIHADLLIEESQSENRLEVVAVSSLEEKKLEATLEVTVTETQSLCLFTGAPSMPSFDVICKVKGRHKKPTAFDVQGQVDSLNLPHTSCIKEPISLQAIGTVSLDQKSPLFLSVKECHIYDKSLDLKSAFTLTPSLRPTFIDLSLQIDGPSNLSCLLPIEGDLEAHVYLDDSSFLASVHSPHLKVDQKSFAPADFYIFAAKHEEEWTGNSSGHFESEIFPFKESFQFSLQETLGHFKKIDISDLSITCAESKLGGLVTYNFEKNEYWGNFFFLADELRPFRFLLPHSELDGKLGGSVSVTGHRDDLSLNLSCLLKNVRYQNSLIHSLHVEAHLDNVLQKPTGKVSYEAKNLFFRDMLLSDASLISEHRDDGFQAFELSLHGDWKQEIELTSSGVWKKDGSDFTLTLNSCEGAFLTQSFSLDSPFTFEKTQESLSLSEANWSLGEGDLTAEFHIDSDALKLQAEGKHVPLGLLGVLYPKMAFQGTASFQTRLEGPGDAVTGYLFAALEKADFSQNKAKGTLQLHLSPSSAQLYTHIYATNQQFLDLTATLPIAFQRSTLGWKPIDSRPITGELTMQGAIEDIFDFVNTASHKATGWVTSHLFLSGTLKDPALIGTLQCEKGSYQNYFTGTQLKEIEAEIEACNSALKLSYLKASDEKQGTLACEGALLLSPEENFPFELKSELSQMHIVHSDFIDASSTGSLQILGNRASAVASGTLTIDTAVFKIFDELPYEIPELPVTFTNKPIYLQASTLQTSTPYPLHFDIQLEAPESVEVIGRGLESTWFGEVKLTGTMASPAAKGSLTLEKGEYTFSGKTFNLRQGEISFSDQPTPSAYLKINGDLPLSSATILAQMQGPLTSPQITFQSIPSLPTSSILALILFDKDISEITALQALQLAQTIMSLSGKGGPGVLESIRKKIGVDRLNIVGKDGTDEISLQIGWYISHGITISLSQSATSSDVTVEVDLKNGFIFQAETQNQEEGKFSLKWNKNY